MRNRTLNSGQEGKIYKGRWNSELELTQAVVNMDKQARYDLADMLLNRVYRLSTCLSGKIWEPEDLTQTAMIEILKSAGTFRGDSTLNRWADRITVHTAFKLIKKRKRQSVLWEKHSEIDVEPIIPDEELDNRLFWEHIQKILESLSLERRTAFVLHHIQEYSIAEIAEITGTLPNTIRDRLRVARKHLRKKLSSDPALKDWVKGKIQ
jgi:RNA polymerase sigma-70 factor (ECF subfamily)